MFEKRVGKIIEYMDITQCRSGEAPSFSPRKRASSDGPTQKCLLPLLITARGTSTHCGGCPLYKPRVVVPSYIFGGRSFQSNLGALLVCLLHAAPKELSSISLSVVLYCCCGRAVVTALGSSQIEGPMEPSEGSLAGVGEGSDEVCAHQRLIGKMVVRLVDCRTVGVPLGIPALYRNQ